MSKRMKKKQKNGNIIDIKDLMDQKKIDDMCNLDEEEFKYAVTHSLLSIVETIHRNSKKFEEFIYLMKEHLEKLNEEILFLKHVLYMERILDGEARNGPMSMEKKASIANAFGIDLDTLMKQITTDAEKKSRRGKKKNSKDDQ